MKTFDHIFYFYFLKMNHFISYIFGEPSNSMSQPSSLSSIYSIVYVFFFLYFCCRHIYVYDNVSTHTRVGVVLETHVYIFGFHSIIYHQKEIRYILFGVHIELWIDRCYTFAKLKTIQNVHSYHESKPKKK